MKDYNKLTREDLIKELVEMHQRIVSLEASEAEYRQIGETLKRRNKELITIGAISQSLNKSLRLESVLQTALDSILEVMGLSSGGISLFDEDAVEPLLTIHKGVSDKFVQVASKVPLNKSIRSMVAKTGKAMITTNLIEDEQLDPSFKLAAELEKVRSLISIPLRSKGRTLGMINVVSHNHRDFLDEEIKLLETIGDQIAIAIENARLFEKMGQLVITDELTGLYNRRHFYELIEAEIYRTQRYGGFCSLIMLDLDGFKEYNDKFGHANGDTILKSFAQVLRQTLRKSDVAFRYGGDEFAVIMSSTGADSSREIMERVRSKWAQIPKAQHSLLESPIGFSVGIAQFPENAETVDGLVFLADIALYHAKRTGGFKSILVSELGALLADVLSAATLDQVYAVAATVDARDPCTLGHSKRVAAVAEIVGKAMGLSEGELADLRAASLLHDIGKVGTPDSILIKPGKLTVNEWEISAGHPIKGAKIVGHISGLAQLVPIIRHHHEWYDGTGYPDGLNEKDIPIAARIICVADAYDTMTTPRLYRNVMSHKEALEELKRCSGTHFDPEVVESLCLAVDKATGQD